MYWGEDGYLMANAFMMLFKLDTDTIALLSLIASVVGVVVGVVSAGAALFAAFYAKKAATKDDVTQVEQNTQYAEHFSNKILSIDTPIHLQEEREASQAQTEQKTSPAQQEASQVQEEVSTAQVQREGSLAQVQQESAQTQPEGISISVNGEAIGEVPLELFLTLHDPLARVSRVERLSEAGKSLGSSPCKATDDAQVFKSILASEKVRQWWDAGESTSEGEARSVLRVYLLLDASGKEVHRDMPISIVEGLRNVGIATLVVWTIKGSI